MSRARRLSRITDSNQEYFRKMSVCGLQEEVVTPGMMAIPTLAGARSRRITYLPLL